VPCEGTIEYVQPDSTNGAPASPAPGPDRPDSIERPELVFAAMFIPIAAFSWCGIALAGAGAFTGWRAFTGGAVISAIALAAAAREYRASRVSAAPVSRRSLMILALTLLTATALFAQPGEYSIEGADASIYLATGRNIVATGGIASEDPVVGLMPRALHGSFFAATALHPNLQNRLPGGVRIGDDGRIHPDFFHLLPAWIAMATAAAGPYGGYFVNVAFGVLGVFAVWLIGRRLWSRAAGGVAAALLAVNFGQIYYARLPASEIMAQFFLLSAAYFTILTWDSRQRAAGACAGAAIGLAAFTRIDLLVLLIPMTVLWLAMTRRGQLGRAWGWYAATFTAISTHASVHAVTAAELYTKRLIGDGTLVLERLSGLLNVTTLVAAVVLTALAVLAIRNLRRRWFAWGALAVLLTLSLLSPAVLANGARLVSALGLIVAAIGVTMILRRPLNWRVLPVLVPVLASTMLMLAWGENSTLPADFRRMVPVILPGVTLLIGFVVGSIANSRGWPSAAIWLLPFGLGGWYLYQASPVLRTPPGQHIHAQLAALAEKIPANAVVLTDRSVPGHLALALQYTFERSALRMEKRPAEGLGIAPLVENVLASGRPLFAAVAPLVAERPSGLRRSDAAGFDMRESSVTSLEYDILVPARGRFPKVLRRDEVPIALYEIKNRDANTIATRPLTFDIGGDDIAFIIRGFHAPEVSQSTRTRWTTDSAQVALPRLGSEGTAHPALVLRLSAMRPPGFKPATVRVSIDDMTVGVIEQTTADLRDYRIALPPAVLAKVLAMPTTLTLTADSFVPKAAGFNDDPRRLGIVLDFVRIE
jgi:hypothetical protein